MKLNYTNFQNILITSLLFLVFISSALILQYSFSQKFSKIFLSFILFLIGCFFKTFT